MNRTLRYRRLAAVAVLLVCGVPARVDAQQFVCGPIARGDTASSLARRLTGTAASAYSHVFQILDPARRMFVPKSQYRRLRTEWQACIATGPLTSTPSAFAPTVASAAPAILAREPTITITPLATTSAPMRLAPTDQTLSGVLFGAAVGAVVLVMLLLSAAAGLLAPRPIPPPIRRAGERFVAAFAQPLVDAASGVPPIETRLRFVRRKRQLQISIAPGRGRRYPNLADHKRNVEYDVNRVIQVLGNRYVVSDRLRAAGKWVVVTIGPADAKQGGAK